MKLRLSLTGRPILTILVIAMLGVGLACAGEKATPTSPPTATTAPTATATTAPTATLVPTATATLVPGAPTPTATAIPMATATAVPEPTATAVPLTWIEKYMQSAGYKPEWGTPQTGGIYKMGVSRNPSDFLANNGSTTNAAFNHPMYNPLIRFDPWIGFDSIIPDLAKSWEWSSDFLHMTMKLEEGVKFQNNQNIPERLRNADFTCEDVQASVERHVRPPKWETKISDGKTMLYHLNGVSCPDGPLGYTAVLSFDLPLGKTMAALAQGPLVMFDKEFIDWMNTERPAALAVTTPAAFKLHTGSGPFVSVEFQPDVIAKERRNLTYFREGLPLLDGIDLYIIKDYTTRFTALVTGQINYFGHGSYTMFAGQVAQAQRDFPERVVIYPSLHNFSYGARFNLRAPPFDDRRVRKAINLAIDRDEWLLFKQAGSFPGAVLTGYLMPTIYWSYTEAELRTWPGIRQPHAQDVAEANRLLDEVFGKGKRFKTTCMATGQDYLDTCLFFIDQMKRHLNVDVVLENVEQAVGTQRTEAGQFDMTGSSPGVSIIGDPDDFLLMYIHRKYATAPSRAVMAAGYAASEPVLQVELEAMIEAQSVEMDPVKRRELVQKIEWKLFDEAMYDVMFGWNYTFPAVTPNVKGFYMYPLWVRTHWSIYERLWLAK